MTRNTAREIAVHLSYEMNFTNLTAGDLLDQRLTAETFATLADEEPLYSEAPNAKQDQYIRRLVGGVAEHAAELDAYIAKYARGWPRRTAPPPTGPASAYRRSCRSSRP